MARVEEEGPVTTAVVTPVEVSTGNVEADVLGCAVLVEAVVNVVVVVTTLAVVVLVVSEGTEVVVTEAEEVVTEAEKVVVLLSAAEGVELTRGGATRWQEAASKVSAKEAEMISRRFRRISRKTPSFKVILL